MHILVINCGSSSIKAAVIEHASGDRIDGFHLERVEDHAAALAEAVPAQVQRLAALDPPVTLDGVGHRVVHGGAKFSQPVRIDADVEAAIESLFALAPLHNPANLAGIQSARGLLPELTHVAVFDTAFHCTLPRRARTYALPTELAEKHQVRRYGFHGTSHAFVAAKAAEYLGEDLRDLRLITCHLGNGASVCAIEAASSVETSMGMTPLEGLVMGTRAGDLDAGAVLHLMRAEGLSIDEVDELLNRKSGLAGLSGVGNDLRDIEKRADEGDDRCRLAIQVFTHRVRKYIGAYAAAMGGVDAIVFTGGIGENSSVIRHRVAQRLDFLGARIDEDLNRVVSVSRDEPVADISMPHSRARLLVVATNEQLEIARQSAALVEGFDRAESGELPVIPVAISARHVHLTKEHVELLFGRGATLTPRNPLSQPGQFACEECVTLVGPKRKIEKVRVLGPTRPGTQVEISRTDEFWLGIDAPVRRSGDISNTPGIVIEGPAGTLRLEQGVICAWRHIHMTPEDAERFGVQHMDLVDVAIDSDKRDLVFGDVMVRVKDTYALEMHIDTDEGNAAELPLRSEGVLAATEGSATIRSRRVDASVRRGRK